MNKKFVLQLNVVACPEKKAGNSLTKIFMRGTLYFKSIMLIQNKSISKYHKSDTYTLDVNSDLKFYLHFMVYSSIHLIITPHVNQVRGKVIDDGVLCICLYVIVNTLQLNLKWQNIFLENK